MTTTAFRKLVDDFSLLDDWEDRYSYLIDLGNKLPPLPEEDRIESNRVEGCLSTVWLVVKQGTGGKIIFHADSDAHIVRGLIAVLEAAYDGLSPEEIGHLSPESIFEPLGLGQHLSPNRRNGFVAMVARLRSLVERAQRKDGEKTPHTA